MWTPLFTRRCHPFLLLRDLSRSAVLCGIKGKHLNGVLTEKQQFKVYSRSFKMGYAYKIRNRSKENIIHNMLQHIKTMTCYNECGQVLLASKLLLSQSIPQESIHMRSKRASRFSIGLNIHARRVRHQMFSLCWWSSK